MITVTHGSLFDEWNLICNIYNDSKFDESLFQEKIIELKNELESSFSLESNAYPEIRQANTSLVNKLLENLSEIIDGNYSKEELAPLINQISNDIAFIEHNEILSLKRTNYQYVQFFTLLILCCIFIVAFLIYFNNKELRNTKKQLDDSKKYLKYIIRTQEDERARISRELHDTVAQDMRYVGLLAGKLPDNNIANEVQQRQSECINQIRNLCYNFAPPDIKTGNMKEALQTLISEFMNKNELDLRLTVLDNVDFSVFTTDELLHFYRIVQEAVTNIQKHANASEATILFRYDKINGNGIYKLLITDDGIGINPELLDEINNTNVLVKKEDGNHF